MVNKPAFKDGKQSIDRKLLKKILFKQNFLDKNELEMFMSLLENDQVSELIKIYS